MQITQRNVSRGQRQQRGFNFYSYFLMELVSNFLTTILFIALQLQPQHWISSWTSSWLLQHWCPGMFGGFIAPEPDTASVIVGARCNWD